MNKVIYYECGGLQKSKSHDAPKALTRNIVGSLKKFFGKPVHITGELIDVTESRGMSKLMIRVILEDVPARDLQSIQGNLPNFIQNQINAEYEISKRNKEQNEMWMITNYDPEEDIIEEKYLTAEPISTIYDTGNIAAHLSKESLTSLKSSHSSTSKTLSTSAEDSVCNTEDDSDKQSFDSDDSDSYEDTEDSEDSEDEESNRSIPRF